MKNIVITRGVFGYVSAPGKPVIAKTPKDPPFAVEDKLADRLVAAKVAAYAEPAPTTGSEGEGKAEYSEAMTRDQLNEIAKSYGVESPDKIKGGKAAVIKAIEAAKAAGGGDEDDGDGSNDEEPPKPGLAAPV